MAAPRMQIDWEHAIERLIERVEHPHQERVKKTIDFIMAEPAMSAPDAAQGHYQWHIDLYDNANNVVARIVCRGIMLRTVYGPFMDGPGKPRGPVKSIKGSQRYKIDRADRKFVVAQ